MLHPEFSDRISASKPLEIDIPEDFDRLLDLAYNFWWSWTPEARKLFNFLAPELWNRYRNPIEILIEMDESHWRPLRENDDFLALYETVTRSFDRYNERFDDHGSIGTIGYFSTEFGIHDSLPIYSGGLGVLSGDHLKASSDCGLSLVGVGLLYRHGYFQQFIDSDGTQHHVFPDQNFSRLPLQQVRNRHGQPLTVSMPLGDEEVQLKVWLVEVGRVPLLLLDTDFPANPNHLRPITGQLYVRGRTMRLCQEVVLGVGGARVLHELDLVPDVWHLNEGHSAFLVAERLRQQNSNGGFESSLKSLRSDQIFTTHTPVVAGHERFNRDSVSNFMEPVLKDGPASVEEFLRLGRDERDDPETFNMTALGMRTSARINGVSELHGEVSRDMWSGILEEQGRSLDHVTNGVHHSTFLGYEIRELFGEPRSPWHPERCRTMLERLDETEDQDLWEAHGSQKMRLVRLGRSILREQRSRHGRGPDELRSVDELIEPDVLTVGFARRFATYKRANLLFRDFERFQAMVTDAEQPVQIIFAGKAHPADSPGQELIREIYRVMNDRGLGHRIFFLENYDLRVASRLVQGVDVWLNTPRRPMEASGTSGMKAALNGVLNLSIVDGWWAEGYTGYNGWTIGEGEEFDDTHRQDEHDATRLYDTLEQQVIPTFYERDERGLPGEWIGMMRDAIRSVLPEFGAYRMVKDYEDWAYEPLSGD